MGVATYKRQLVEGIDCKISVVITPPNPTVLVIMPHKITYVYLIGGVY